MCKYIEKNGVISLLVTNGLYEFPDSIKQELAEKALEDISAIDVVYCRECKWFETKQKGCYCNYTKGGLWCINGNCFCSYGVRKEGRNE